MKAKELIKQLQKLPPNTEIYLDSEGVGKAKKLEREVYFVTREGDWFDEGDPEIPKSAKRLQILTSETVF